jgi:ribosome-associated heat shock protein Hsp15
MPTQNKTAQLRKAEQKKAQQSVPAAALTSVRVDSWIWAVRLLKSRSAATDASKGGHVTVNDERAKAAQAVRIGDEVRVRSGEGERIVVVARLVTKRVGAAVAVTCYTDLTPPPPPKEERVVIAVRDRGAGRPTKRDRRELDKLRAPRADRTTDDWADTGFPADD